MSGLPNDSRVTDALVASLATLLDAARQSAAWELAPLGHWLVSFKSFWRVAGHGDAFDEMCRVLTDAGRSFERCAAEADLVVIEGPLSDDQEDPDHWIRQLLPDAIVLIVGVQRGAGASVLWRNWAGRADASAVFRRASTYGGVAILLPQPEKSPLVLRELLRCKDEATRLFEATIAAAEYLAQNVRQLQEAEVRALIAKADALRLSQGLKATRTQSDLHGGMSQGRMLLKDELSLQQARVDELQHYIRTLESTNTYRAAMVMRRIATRLPPPLRILLRRMVKLIWWTLRGQLGVAWRARQAFLRQQKNDAAVTEPATAASATTKPEQLAGAFELDLVATPGVDGSLLAAAVGYAAEDADMPRLLRAIERAQRALVTSGRKPGQGVFVADAGAPMALKGWLPAQIPVLPCRSRLGFSAAHRLLMELTFAQGADVYALAEVGARFSEDALLQALRVLGIHGGKALVWVGELLPEGLPDPVSPGMLVIPGSHYSLIGPVNEDLDKDTVIADLCLRARALGIPVLSLPGASRGTDSGWKLTLASRGMTTHSLDAAWRLASIWGSQPLLTEVSGWYRQNHSTPVQVEAGTYAGLGMDAPLMAWWKRRISLVNSIVTEPKSQPVVMEVPAPSVLDQSLAVPFAFAGLPAKRSGAPRVAAVIHLYYEDLAQATLEVLQHIPLDCDVYISTDSEHKRLGILSTFSRWTSGALDVRVLPNRGSDVGPFLEILREIRHRYDLLLHLHGKKSLHWDRGHGWRQHLYDTLCGSAAIVSSVLQAFESSPLLGMVFPQHWTPVRPAVTWGYSFEDALELAGRIGMDLRHDQPLDFPTGSMFWARPAALRPMLDFGVGLGDYADEAGAITYAHALERLLLRACEHSGHTWLKIARSGSDEVTPPPLSVLSVNQLDEMIGAASFLLSDPALRSEAHGNHPWRFRPEAQRPPRWTLVCCKAPFPEQLQALQSLCDAQMRIMAPLRVAIVPGSRTDCPPPLDVRCSEVFIAADESCAQVALQLCHVQKAFFGRSSPVRLLKELGLSDDRFIEVPVSLPNALDTSRVVQE